MLDDAGVISGVIDWGDLHLGDAALDLAVADLVLPPGTDAASRFSSAYGDVDASTRRRARYSAIYNAALFTEYGLRSGDPFRAGFRRNGTAPVEGVGR
jgi:aminoglycoside phosphotransferase (APT) family kinase protein